jgi:hypothetical protein
MKPILFVFTVLAVALAGKNVDSQKRLPARIVHRESGIALG